MPYFSVIHVVRGQLFGPYSKLPIGSPLRRLALDVVFNLMSMEGGAHNGGLHDAIDLAVANTEEEYYWTQLWRLG